MVRLFSGPMEMKEPSGNWSRNCFGTARRPFESTFIREEPANIHFPSFLSLSLDRGDGDERQLGRCAGCLTRTLCCDGCLSWGWDHHSSPLITTIPRNSIHKARSVSIGLATRCGVAKGQFSAVF